jgi:MFS family permease
MAFLYPSLMANVVNRVDETERASALSTFTMFFEIGSIVGGVALGAIAQVFTKSAGFLGGAVITALGMVALWRTVVESPALPVLDGNTVREPVAPSAPH